MRSMAEDSIILPPKLCEMSVGELKEERKREIVELDVHGSGFCELNAVALYIVGHYGACERPGITVDHREGEEEGKRSLAIIAVVTCAIGCAEEGVAVARPLTVLRHRL